MAMNEKDKLWVQGTRDKILGDLDRASDNSVKYFEAYLPEMDLPERSERIDALRSELSASGFVVHRYQAKRVLGIYITD